MKGIVPSPARGESPKRPEGERKRVDETLRDSEERYRMIVDSCPSMMWATSAEGVFNFTNKVCCEFFGMTHEKLEAPKRPRLVHPDESPGFYAAFNRAVGDRATFRMEARFRRADGEWRLLEVFAEPMFSSSGEYLGHIGLCADITERIRAEDALRDSEQRHRQIVNSSNEGIWQIDKDRRTIAVNARLASMLGYERSEMLGRSEEYFLFEDELKEQAERLEARRKGVAEQYECRWRHKDGRSVWTMVSATPVMDANNLFCGVLGMITDISERKRTEEALRISERLHRTLFESAGDAIFLVRDGIFIDCNEMTLQMYGCTREQIIGHSPIDFSPPMQPDGRRSPEAAMDNINLALSTKTSVRFEWQHSRADKTTFEAEVSLNQLDLGGKVYLMAIVKDISARKCAELELEQHRAHLEELVAARTEELTVASGMLRALIDNIPDFIYVKDAQSRFIVANPYMARMMGAETPGELLGKTDFDFYPKEVAKGFYEDEQKMLRSGQSLYNHEETSLDSAGNKVHLLTTKVPLRDNEGRIIGIAGIGRDITKRKKVENELFEAVRKYRGIFDNALFGVFQSTPDGRLLSINPAMARIFGHDFMEEDIANITDIERQFYVDPNGREEFKRLISKTGVVQNHEFEAFRKDGSKVWLSVSARAICQDGVVVRFEGMCQDITERKQLQVQLLQAQKLESVGQLAAGIAHEINTPIQYIGDNVRFMKDAFQDIKKLLANYERLLSAAHDKSLSRETIQLVEVEAAERAVKSVDVGYLLEEIPKAVDQTLEGVSRVAAIVGAMKEFSHPDTKEKIPLDLNHAINSTITVARNEWKYVADMKTEFDPSLPLVSCLPGEFNQVILNLIVNAAHAIADVVKKGGQEKGTITVQTRNCSEWAEIRIQDTGTGIPKTVQSRIFDPFFTTKEIGKGTGQGLAIARSVIVGKHGGSIHFETEEGKGTTFIIRLPFNGKALLAQVVAA
jgi:PAS domain S-box-containing protein